MKFQLYEPKVAFRYKLVLGDLPAYSCKASGMPKIANSKITMDYINTDFKVKGKSRWNDITVTLYDYIEEDAAKKVHDWIKIHHDSDGGVDGFAAAYKRQITLQALDPAGSPVETWTLHGAYIVDSDWGEMDWASGEEFKTVTITISYDYAILG